MTQSCFKATNDSQSSRMGVAFISVAGVNAVTSGVVNGVGQHNRVSTFRRVRVLKQELFPFVGADAGVLGMLTLVISMFRQGRLRVRSCNRASARITQVRVCRQQDVGTCSLSSLTILVMRVWQDSSRTCNVTRHAGDIQKRSTRILAGRPAPVEGAVCVAVCGRAVVSRWFSNDGPAFVDRTMCGVG